MARKRMLPEIDCRHFSISLKLRAGRSRTSACQPAAHGTSAEKDRREQNALTPFTPRAAGHSDGSGRLIRRHDGTLTSKPACAQLAEALLSSMLWLARKTRSVRRAVVWRRKCSCSACVGAGASAIVNALLPCDAMMPGTMRGSSHLRGMSRVSSRVPCRHFWPQDAIDFGLWRRSGSSGFIRRDCWKASHCWRITCIGWTDSGRGGVQDMDPCDNVGWRKMLISGPISNFHAGRFSG